MSAINIQTENTKIYNLPYQESLQGINLPKTSLENHCQTIIINHASGQTPANPSLKTTLNEVLRGQNIANNQDARIWGDPHIEDADGGKFDFQGQVGQTYNLFNDSGLNINGEFVGCSNPGKTVIGKMGFKVGSDEIVFQARPDTKVFHNGKEVKGPSQTKLADGSFLVVTGGTPKITLSSKEGYRVSASAVNPGTNGEIDMTIHSGANGVFTDGRMPGGILGETFDADQNARNSSGQQGEGAINFEPSAYQVEGGIFASPKNEVTYQNPELKELWKMAFPNTPLPQSLIQESPITGENINWNEEAKDCVSKMMENNMYRQCKAEARNKANEGDRLIQIMLAAISSGNINLAMMMFAHIQSKNSNEVAKGLVQKLQKLQSQKQELVSKIDQTDDAKNLQKLNHEIGSVNDDISTLQTFIKEVIQNKNQAIEFSSNFMSMEHQTTMSVIRSMR